MEKHARILNGIHDNIIQRMRFGCLLDKARNTYSEYVEHIRFPHQQQLHIRKNISFLPVHCSGVPRNFVRAGFNKFS